MSKSNEQRLARQLQAEAHVSYSEALRRVRATAADAICKVCDRELRHHANGDHEFASGGRNARFVEGTATHAAANGIARRPGIGARK